MAADMLNRLGALMGHASSRAKKFTITAPKVKQLLGYPTSSRVAKLLKSLDFSPRNSILHTPPPSLLSRDPGGLTLGPLLHQTQGSRLPVDSQNPKHLPPPLKSAVNTHTHNGISTFYSLLQKHTGQHESPGFMVPHLNGHKSIIVQTSRKFI